jgi:iron complex outermembrane receptor protein
LTVITGEDIRRTGHHTLADALRTAPGVFVGQSASNEWIVGMRGFSFGLANKTLVLIDGRAVYDPLFAGTFWDVQDVLMDDVERIEVIRGPGATLWGANAVNGVINVITKSAEDTQGGYLRGGAGTEEQGFVAARYGGKLTEKGAYRVWGKYFDRDHLRTTDGESAHDKWDLGHGGFRIDLRGDERTSYTLQGDIYDEQFDERLVLPVPDANFEFEAVDDHGEASGGNVLFRLNRALTDTAGWRLQAYYDHTYREVSAGFEAKRDTADVDFRHYFQIARVHDVLWGAAYRYTHDDTSPALDDTTLFVPDSRSLKTYSAFVQDTITLVPERVFAMLGSKFDHNSYTGFEVQPSARLWWTPDASNTLWAAVSRPVRHPARLERDGFVTLAVTESEPGVFTPLQVSANPDLESERLIAYELGYRRRITKSATLDLAAFYNDYTQLIFLQPTVIGAWTDEGSGESYGGEAAATWRVNDRWRLDGSYSYVDVEIHGPVLPQDEGNSPVNQVKLRSAFDVTKALELNSALYYVDRMPTPDADPYVRFDVGLAWRPRENLELRVWGQNLLERSHREASDTVEVERAGYIEAIVKF